MLDAEADTIPDMFSFDARRKVPPSIKRRLQRLASSVRALAGTDGGAP